MSKKNNKQVGDVGERIACRFLIKQGFQIVERNYTKKFGEIDIIGKKQKNIYFFEVKTNTVNSAQNTDRPEERVDKRKLYQIGKVAQVYLQEKNLTETDWYFRVIAILFNPDQKTAHIKMINDVIPE